MLKYLFLKILMIFHKLDDLTVEPELCDKDFIYFSRHMWKRDTRKSLDKFKEKRGSWDFIQNEPIPNKIEIFLQNIKWKLFLRKFAREFPSKQSLRLTGLYDIKVFNKFVLFGFYKKGYAIKELLKNGYNILPLGKEGIFIKEIVLYRPYNFEKTIDMTWYQWGKCQGPIVESQEEINEKYNTYKTRPIK